MKQDFAFVAERALACHSPALMRPGPADTDLIEALRQAAARLARSLRGGLARLCGGDPPEMFLHYGAIVDQAKAVLKLRDPLDEVIRAPGGLRLG